MMMMMKKTIPPLTAAFGRSLAALLCGAAIAAHAAAPTAENTQTQLAAGQPPTLSNFRADNGAPISWDKDVALTWLQQGLVTQWRVGFMQSFIGGSQWMALPMAQPYKYQLGINPSEGTHHIYMQLRNEHGESAVASTTIEYRAAPRIKSAKATAAHDGFRYLVGVDLLFSGAVTHYALTGSAQPPGSNAGWAGLIAPPATGSRSIQHDLRTLQPAPTLVSGSTLNAWIHMRRDGSPVDTKQLSFVYTGPQHTYPVEAQTKTAFVERLGRRNRITAQRLSSTGNCAILSARTGGAYGPQGFYAVAGTAPMTTPVVCRFNVFDGQPLAPGWALQANSVTLWKNDCRLMTTTVGSSPNIVLEVAVKVDPMPTSKPKVASCHLGSLSLRGPWSEDEAAWRAIP